MTEASLLGTVAAWTRRYCPIIFAGDERHAADLAWRYLAGQITEARKIVAAAERAKTNMSSAEGVGVTERQTT